MSQHSLRDPRYPLSDSGVVKVSIAKKTESETTDIPGVLVDLSRRGLQLKLAEPLPRGERVRLTLSADHLGFELHSYARIRWTEHTRRNEWLIGCALEAHVEEKSIDILATSGALERRRDVRRPVSCFSTEIKCELKRDFQTAQVLDFSSGGFCALTGQLETQSGNRLLLKVLTDSGDELIPARVVWVNDFESGQAIGCEFVDRDDHLLMRAIATKGSNPTHTEAQSHANKWSMIAAGTVGIIFLFQLFWL